MFCFFFFAFCFFSQYFVYNFFLFAFVLFCFFVVTNHVYILFDIKTIRHVWMHDGKVNNLICALVVFTVVNQRETNSKTTSQIIYFTVVWGVDGGGGKGGGGGGAVLAEYVSNFKKYVKSTIVQ